MFEFCAEPDKLSGLTWLSCYLTTGVHFSLYWAFGKVLWWLRVTFPPKRRRRR